MSKIIKPQKLKGFKDDSPQIMKEKNTLLSLVRQISQLHGFDEIHTPALEYTEVLLGAGSDETDKQVYRFEDHGKRNVAMRFDLTVPFARYMAEHHSTTPIPFKKLHIGSVWRGENTQKGRYREFMQADLDIIGTKSPWADFEIIELFMRIFVKLPLGGVEFQINHRELLNQLIKKHLSEEASFQEILIILDKMDKIGPKKVAELLHQKGYQKPEALLEALKTEPSQLSDLDLPESEELESFFKTLEHLQKQAKALSTKQNTINCRLNLSTARGLGYYTGIVFETVLKQLPKFGSVCSGGRYDNLASRFTKLSLPGVGASIGVDRLIAGTQELGVCFAPQKKLVTLVTFGQENIPATFELAQKLRSQNISVEVGLHHKPQQQLKTADAKKSDYVIFVGAHEIESGQYKLKDMQEGSEDTLSVEKIILRLREIEKQLS